MREEGGDVRGGAAEEAKNEPIKGDGLRRGAAEKEEEADAVERTRAPRREGSCGRPPRLRHTAPTPTAARIRKSVVPVGRAGVTTAISERRKRRSTA